MNTASSWRWSAHTIPAKHKVLRVETTVTLIGDTTIAGLMCGNSASTGTTPTFIYAVIDSGTWHLGTLTNQTFDPKAGGQLPQGALPDADGTAKLALECAVTSATADRALLLVNGVPVGDVSGIKQAGPYDRAALYAEIGTTAPGTSRFDDLVVSTGEAYKDPVAALLTHVPSAFRGNCLPATPNASTGQVAGVVCNPAGAADQAEYYQYDTQADADADFTAIVQANGNNPSGTDCKTGSSQYSYTINQVPAGTLACYDNTGSLGGVVFIWTDDQLSMIAVGVLKSGSYSDLHAWWVSSDSGPIR